SEKGSVTNASGVTSAINNTGTTSASLMQYYQFSFTFNHVNNSGDVYSGYGYHNYAANKTITNVALTSNVATITTSAAHGYSVGDIVTVDASNNTFDGNYIVTAKTDTTFSYAKTYTGTIASVSATGSTSDAYTANETIATANGTYTISYIYASSYGTDGQVYVYNYNDEALEIQRLVQEAMV
ncbi:MAG: hypothetical protein EBT49_10025, partial [Betaproteobacteria bacterium]|nr:hypothetical protein [Betaproteobacteria bacterium]